MAKTTTSDWAAWVNLMPPLPTPGGTLHVIGTVDTHSSDFAFLEKRAPQGINKKILQLDLKVETGTVPAKNPQLVHYRESLTDRYQYHSVEVFYKQDRVALIDEIKEIH